MNVESGKTPRAATQENESDQPAELNQTNAGREIRKCQRPNSPCISEKCRRHAEADYVGERIELLAEFAIRAHGAGDSPIERIEKNCEADRAGSFIEIR